MPLLPAQLLVASNVDHIPHGFDYRTSRARLCIASHACMLPPGLLMRQNGARVREDEEEKNYPASIGVALGTPLSSSTMPTAAVHRSAAVNCSAGAKWHAAM